MKNRIFLVSMTLLVSILSSAAVTIKTVGGWFESGYVTWELINGASSYNVYYQLGSGGTYLKLDAQLVRNYGTYGRADVLGVAAGQYQCKVVPVNEEGSEMVDQATESTLFVAKAHDRTGFAHFNYSGVGAYKDNGTLKEKAQVIYVTAKNAKTVTATVAGSQVTGFQAIMNAREKGTDVTPLCVRIVGTIEAADMDAFSSTEEGLQIKGKGAYSEMNITIEGVGNDAVIRGFGMLLRNCKSVELRNFAVMLCMDDCLSLDTNNSNCWIHNIDFFYGRAGSAADQVKGDGSLDCKGDSKYLTFSYNHFWDSGKMSLCGMKDETGENFITYHHNWFDHSDSRHPRVRSMTVHVYTNYFDGNSKYGVGATTSSTLFVESNYYRNVNRPMMISLQGTDIKEDSKGTFSGENGGMIKAFGNVYAEQSAKFSLITHKQSATGFDCYEATTRDEQVPSTYVALVGKSGYNNFDTDPTKMYLYTADVADEVPTMVTGQYGAGRMAQGDFKWAFNNSVDDASDAVNTPLKNAITNYASTLVGIFGDETDSGDGGDEPVVPEPSGYDCHFTESKPSNTFYTIVGSYTTKYGSATVNGVEYGCGLKMESSTRVSFTTSKEMVLTLVFASGSVPDIKIDGVDKKSTSDNVITATLAAGAHVLSKKNQFYLFYINLTDPDGVGIEQTVSDNIDENAPLYDLTGRVVKNPQKGIYIKAGKKLFIQ